ncbi:MAG TPA: hypothetical protein VKL99_15145 [Candidatus Angelobacter sp.]|nr:hypothetical protein [Candidatus Angelobacter sp.]
MARLLALLLTILNGTGHLYFQAAPSPATGSICIAAVEAPNTGEKSLSNPAGGNRIQHYAVRIDDLPLVHTDSKHGFRTPPLEYARKHRVRIIGDGKPVASFYFKFDEFKTNNLCLFMNTLYETWQLWDMKETGRWCSCRRP